MNHPKVGIVSDSHDNRDALKAAVRMFNRMECGLVVHAGDFVAPFAAGELSELTCPVKAVFGNCDGEKEGLRRTIGGFGEIREAPFEFVFGGQKFLVTHTQFSNRAYLASQRCDVLIYGHTHKPDIRFSGQVLVINPGECGGWVSGKSTAALLDLETMEADILSL